jgi:gluconate 2-dehydrogenase gamma chain
MRLMVSKQQKSPKDNQPLKVLTRNETRLLEAVADRIFPATNTPGAVEAGAVNYIHQALVGDYASLVSLYRKGLRAVERHGRRRFGARFSALKDVEKDAILLDFEAGDVSDFKRAAAFFEIVRCHVLEGVFGEPDYGGNKNLIGWRLVEFPGQQFGYPDAYINKRVDLSPLAVTRPRDAGSNRG